MQFLIDIAMVGLLVILIYQDFRYRLVSAFILVVLFLLNAAFGVLQIGVSEWLQQFSLNILLLSLELFLCWAFLSFIKKQRVAFTDHYLGWGDILFLGIMASMFSTFNFILALPVSLLVVMLAYAVVKLFGITSGDKIPLAGALSLLLVSVRVFFIFQTESFYFNDIVKF